ncbi:MAG: cell division protein FtsZ [Yoonia sp.]|jgi:cell division protein FtsZ
MNPENSETTRVPSAITGLSLKVFGLGTAGCNLADHLSGVGLSGAEFFAMDSDAQSLSRCGIENRTLIGEQTTGGLGGGGDLERGRAAIREDVEVLEEIDQICEGTDLVFILAGLGGGTGAGAAPIIAAKAKEAGALVIGFVTLPFDLEGRHKGQQAMEGLADLQKSADGVICLPNQMVFKLIDENTSLPETFKTTNDYVAHGVRAIWKLVAEPGKLNLGFADLRKLIHGQHSHSSFATVEAGGPQRIRDAAESLVAHPLLDDGKVLAEAETVLVSVCGSASISVAELTRLSEQLQRQCEQAEIKIGAIIDDSLGDQISVTLVAARRDSATDPEVSELSRVCGDGDNGVPLTALTGPPGTRNNSEPDEEPANAAPSPVGKSWRRRGKRERSVHPQLPLDMAPKGRFDKGEPTLYKGEDLDIPTFVRRGVPFNLS